MHKKINVLYAVGAEICGCNEFAGYIGAFATFRPVVCNEQAVPAGQQHHRNEQNELAAPFQPTSSLPQSPTSSCVTQ
jgi:hypothetical protein